MKDIGKDRDQLYTTSEVAELFGVDIKTVTRWATRGLLPHIKTPGGQRRFWGSDIERAMRHNN